MNFNRRTSNASAYFVLNIILLFVFAAVSFGQSETATVLGTVRDANGSVIGGANVTLTNIGTQIAAKAVTDESGDYQFTNVKIGNYEITIEATGFNRTRAENINLAINARQRVDLALEIATATETVTVTDAANPLQTESSEVGQVIQRQQIVALPLNGRSYANLALLAPGVRESHTNSSIGGGMNRVLDAFVGGWMINGINTMTSGQPINFRNALTGDAAITNNLPSFLGGIALRPNISCDPVNREDRPDPTRGYFLPGCVSRPSAFSPFGNAGRNIARSDSYFNLDLALQKEFKLPITDETRLQFRAEFFNLFNRTNFQATNSDITSANFGVISSAFPARQIQLALKFSF